MAESHLRGLQLLLKKWLIDWAFRIYLKIDKKLGEGPQLFLIYSI